MHKSPETNFPTQLGLSKVHRKALLTVYDGVVSCHFGFEGKTIHHFKIRIFGNPWLKFQLIWLRFAFTVQFVGI